MNVQLFFTNMGQVIGEIVHGTLDHWYVKRPALVGFTPQGLSLLGLLEISTSDTLRIDRHQLVIGNEPVEVIGEIANAYSSQFGSGIQIASAGAVR